MVFNFQSNTFCISGGSFGFKDIPADHALDLVIHGLRAGLAEVNVDPVMVKKIVGHSGAMTLTERVYTHPDIQALVDAINKLE